MYSKAFTYKYLNDEKTIAIALNSTCLSLGYVMIDWEDETTASRILLETPGASYGLAYFWRWLDA